MKFSIGIPTYNRGPFLEKNLKGIAKQIRDNNLNKEVEINISNNGSTDDTEVIISSFIEQNSDLCVSCNKFLVNEGPDKNYIATMQMAHGEYSILLGDDDYIVEGGLLKILQLIEKYKDIDVFLSNRTEIDESGNIIGYRSFLHQDITSRKFDFGDDNQAGFYFSLCDEVGGCLTFISSIIYKTQIMEEMGPYNHCLDGTFYSFWFYLWGKLSKGGKLYYLSDSYILNTQAYNNNFGQGLKRSLVEFEGFQKAAELFFYNKSYKKCFLDVPRRWKRMSDLLNECIQDEDSCKKRLMPVLRRGDSKAYTDDIELFLSWRYHYDCFRKLFKPRYKFIMKLFSIERRILLHLQIKE